MRLKKNKGILFWITGLSGSGKTAIAEKIKSHISNKYGPTVIVSGDNLRKIYNFKKFSRKDRLAYALIYSEFCKCVTDNKINVILSTVSLFHKVRKWNRSNINNYIEIYIQSDINKIIKQKRKFFYKGNYKNIIGKNIKAEFPQSPNITIINHFEKPINSFKPESKEALPAPRGRAKVQIFNSNANLLEKRFKSPFAFLNARSTIIKCSVSSLTIPSPGNSLCLSGEPSKAFPVCADMPSKGKPRESPTAAPIKQP